MHKIIFISSVIALGGLMACGDSNNGSKTGGNAESAAQQQDTRLFVMANDFSDAEWKNGIQRKDGRANVFYFIQKNGESLNMKVGDTLNFSKTGNVVVQKIYPSAPNKDGIISIFVTIDKDLDPIGDGYPNKIFLQSKQ